MGVWAAVWGLIAPAIGWTILLIWLRHDAVTIIATGAGGIHISVTTAFVISGLVAGAVSGLGFAILLMTAQRGRDVSKLSLPTFALLGALPPAALLGFGSGGPLFAAVGAIVGAAAAATMLWIARRSPQRNEDLSDSA